MRRAVILVLLVWLVVGGLSTWAQADRPGWVPAEFKRGGGDELESSTRMDPDGLGDDADCGMAPSSPAIVPESGFEFRSGSVSTPTLPAKADLAVWWVYSLLRRW